MSSEQAPLIQLDHIGKRYPLVSRRGDRLRALFDLLRGRELSHASSIIEDVSFTVAPGRSLAIIGENGAGKSTLLKIIAGVLEPTSGTVKTRGRIGALLELGAGFHMEYSGRENLFLAGALMGLSRKDVHERFEEIEAFADIGQYIEEPIKHYSSGMVVRLGFALIAVTRPELLITDEVLAVGDESFQKKCIRWMEDYLSDGGTLLVVSHSMYHVQKLCHDALWLHEGRVREYGSSNLVSQRYLAYHERKLARMDTPADEQATYGEDIYAVDSLIANGSKGRCEIASGAELRMCGRVYSPDGRTPQLGLGIVRVDGTPIYGGTTELDGARLKPDEESGYFRFDLVFPELELLPGEYQFRAHALDPEAMRHFDTRTLDLVVTGDSRELGLCRLRHEWR